MYIVRHFKGSKIAIKCNYKCLNMKSMKNGTYNKKLNAVVSICLTIVNKRKQINWQADRKTLIMMLWKKIYAAMDFRCGQLTFMRTEFQLNDKNKKKCFQALLYGANGTITRNNYIFNVDRNQLIFLFVT